MIKYESATLNRTVKGRVSEFRMGRTSPSDEPRSGRPNEVTNPEMIKKPIKSLWRTVE